MPVYKFKDFQSAEEALWHFKAHSIELRVPFVVWMRSGKLHGLVNDTLRTDGIFNLIPLEGRKKLLTKFENGKIRWSRVWALIVLSKFL